MMLPPKFNLQEERDFGEKLNGCFTFVSQNFKPLLLSLIKTALPLAIVGGIAQGIYTSGLFSSIRDINEGISSNAIAIEGGNNPFNLFNAIFSPAYFISILFIFLAMTMVNVIVFGYMKIYNSNYGEEVTFESLMEIVKSKFLIVAAANFITTVLAVIALLFLVIPGIYLAIVFSLVIPVLIIEDKSITQAISRCFVLIKDKWWSTLGIIIISAMISYMMSMIFALPEMALTIFQTMNLFKEDLKFLHIITSVISTSGQYILYSFISIAIGIQYFNLHERIEGAGLRAQIEKIGFENKPDQLNSGEF